MALNYDHETGYYVDENGRRYSPQEAEMMNPEPVTSPYLGLLNNGPKSAIYGGDENAWYNRLGDVRILNTLVSAGWKPEDIKKIKKVRLEHRDSGSIGDFFGDMLSSTAMIPFGMMAGFAAPALMGAGSAAGGAQAGAGAVGADAGLGAAEGTLAGSGAAAGSGWAPAAAQLAGAGEFSTAMPWQAALMEAQTAAGAGLTAAEMQALGIPAWAAYTGSLPLPQIKGPTPAGGGLLDKAKNIPTLPGGLGGQGGLLDGGEGGESGSIWSDYVNPMSFNPIEGPQFQQPGTFASPYGFDAELQKRLALIRGAR
jgi:hypothetical protein